MLYTNYVIKIKHKGEMNMNELKLFESDSHALS